MRELSRARLSFILIPMRLGFVYVTLLFFLALRFFFFYQNQPKYYDGQDVNFETTLLSEPLVVGNKQKISLDLNGGSRILVTSSFYPQFHYADTLRIWGTLKYKSLSNKKTIITMSYPKIEVVKDDKNLFLAAPSLIRQKAISLFDKTLPSNSSALLLGIVFGIKESMSKDFSDNLRISGVFHVVAASGMNVTFVGGFLSSIFGWFLKRQIAIVFSIIGVLFYALLAGFEASILRASIMGILVFTAQLMGRQNLAAYGLFIAGFLMLFFSPNLMFDVGFQLSFLATIGLLYIRPLFEISKKAKVILNRSIVGEGVVTTIAAQTATIPILVSNFGTYSFWSVVANGLVLWTIPTLMAVGGVGAMVGIIFPQGGQLILYLSLPFLIYFEKIVIFFGKAEGVVSLKDLPWQFIVGYYFILAGLIIYFSRKR